MKNLARIGVVESVSLPDERIKAVPAKIDTGADSSAIWANEIQEKTGRLSFKLFGPESLFYTGRRVETDDYQIISVKNSFGQSEFRYKVKLKVSLGGRTIRAKFTLADRSRSRFPILIGRRTLQGKFLVDATRRTAKSKYQVLMMSTRRTAVTADFARRVQASGKKLEITYASYDELMYVAGPGGIQVSLIETGQDIAEFDLIHFKTSARFADIAATVARCAGRHGVLFIDESIRYFPASSKLYQYAVIAGGELAVPPTIFLFPAVLARSYEMIRDQLGLPFIVKDLQGNKGEFNFLIKDKKSFLAACRQAVNQNLKCMAQAYIPNEGDYRVLVLGHRIGLVIHRKSRGGSHLNNTSRGGTAELVPAAELPAVIQTACIAAAKALERQVAGVDIVQDKNSGLWYCLEVNDGPQLATGSFTAEKQAAFAAYLERKLDH